MQAIQAISRICALAMVMPLIGGGFYLELGTPSANHDPKAKGAVVVARFSGCHQPEKGILTATAEGFVAGKREVIPLKTVVLSSPGQYAIAKQWPAEGKWALKLVGTHPDFAGATTTIVRVNGDSFDRASVVMKIGSLGDDAVNALLR